MEVLHFRNINITFHCVCLLVAIIYGINSFYDFIQNQDFTTISFKRFHDDAESIYPLISMCFNTPFIKDRLIQSAQLSEPIDYTRYLIGKIPANESLRSLNFEDVSFQTKYFLIMAYIKFIKKGRLLKRVIKDEQIHIQSWGWVKRVSKCFTFDVPYLGKALAKSMKIRFNTSIYPNGQRPMDGGEPGGFQLSIHYPKQFGISLKSVMKDWPRQNESQGYKMSLYLREVEILRRRNKPQATCTNSPPYDDVLVQHIIDSLNCTPPYFNISIEMPICKTSQSLRKATRQFKNIFYGIEALTNPCKQVLNIDSNYVEQPASGLLAKGLGNDEVLLSVYYRPRHYREIRQIRAYNAMTLFGNVEGFIGMLLGYAFVQIPMLLRTLFESLKDRILHRRQCMIGALTQDVV